MRWVGPLALLLTACVGPSDAPPLAPRLYTFGGNVPSCIATVLEVFDDGTAELRHVGASNYEPIAVDLERTDAEILLTPLEGDLRPYFSASSAVLRRTTCGQFEVTLRASWGSSLTVLSAADPCIDEPPPPEHGNEWEPCQLRLCNRDPC